MLHIHVCLILFYQFNNENVSLQMYPLLERISPRTRKLELFARMHNTHAGYVSFILSLLFSFHEGFKREHFSKHRNYTLHYDPQNL